VTIWPFSHSTLTSPRVSLVSKIQSCGRAASEFQERDPKVVGLSPGKARDFCPVQRVLPALRPAQPPVHYVLTFFPGLKRQVDAVNLTLPPSSAEVGSEWSYTSTLPCVFVMCTRETSLFRRVCKIAKSDYWFRYVRPSVRPPACNNSNYIKTRK
jgi:hypothetical protein